MFKEEQETRDKLKDRGYSLKEKWETYFPDISEPLRISLQKAPGIATLEDIVVLCKRPRLLECFGVGKNKIQKLRKSFSSRNMRSLRGQWKEISWESGLGWSSKGVSQAFSQLGAKTLYDVWVLLEHPFFDIRGTISLRRFLELKHHLNQMLESPQVVSRSKKLSTPDELISEILSKEEGRELWILENRYLKLRSLASCGRELGLTRERLRQLSDSIIIRLRNLYMERFQEACRPLLYALEESGNFLPIEVLPEYDCQSAGIALLSLVLSGRETYRVYKNKYLTCLSAGELNKVVTSLREGLRSSGQVKINYERASEISCRIGGICLDSEHVGRVLDDLRVAHSTGEEVLIPQRLSRLVERVLKNSGCVMEGEEIEVILRDAGVGVESIRSIEGACQANKKIYPMRDSCKGSYRSERENLGACPEDENKQKRNPSIAFLYTL